MRHRLALVLVLGGAFALRLFRLPAQSIWWDEGISLHLATSSWTEIALNRMVNIHPPLYFWGLKGWVTLLGVSAFSGRYLSVLASLLQVVLVYALLRRWLRSRRTAWVGLLLTAVAPLSILYGQEIRAYAILPLIYLLLLLVTRELLHAPSAHIQSEPGASPSEGLPAPYRPQTILFVALGLVTWIGLHLHYIVLFAVFYVNVWALGVWGRRRQWSQLRRWLITQFAAAAASLPWLAAVLWNWSAVQAEASAGTYLTASVPPLFLLAQVGVFHLTALPGSLGRPLVDWLAGGTAVILFLLLLLRLARLETRRWTAMLAAHWFVPLSLAVVVWSLRSFSHPRYISLYALMLLPLAAWLIQPFAQSSRLGSATPPRRQRFRLQPDRLLGIAAAIGLLSLSLWANGVYFFDPKLAQNDDMRGVARYLEEQATAADLILIPDTDWSLPFEYGGEALVQMPGLSTPEQMWANLAQWTSTRRRVFSVRYPRLNGPDWQQALPFALEVAGTLVAEATFDGLEVQTYQLDGPVAAPQLQEIDGRQNGRFDALALTGFWVETAAPAHNGIAVALRWRVTAPVQAEYDAKLTLLDVDGWPLASSAHTLTDARGRPPALWDSVDSVTTFDFLPLPWGTPPLTYTVALEVGIAGEGGLHIVDVEDAAGLPQGQRMLLAESMVTPAIADVPRMYAPVVGIPALPQPALLTPGLQLVGATIDRQTAGPGQPLFVQLHWQRTGTAVADVRPTVSLVQAGQALSVLEESPVLQRYPTDVWQVGETVVEHRRLTIPAEAAGEVDVVLAVGENQVVLGQVKVDETVRLFTAPALAQPVDVSFGGVARLLGYDLPAQVTDPTTGVPLTLYWEAQRTGADTGYTVFAHLLDQEGRLIGQHDAVPGNGTRPTTGWVAGEIVFDEHLMTLREPYLGEAIVEVGLYDPATGVRLFTETGQDFFYLPLRVTITD